MVVSKPQERPADVVLRNTYAATREANTIAQSRWAVDPGLLRASPGDTVKWTVHDSNHLDIEIKDISGKLFVHDSLEQHGNIFRAKISSDVEYGHFYEYRFFWGNNEAHGGSAPGVIIE